MSMIASSDFSRFGSQPTKGRDRGWLLLRRQRLSLFDIEEIVERDICSEVW
jgi:hypothetical protein